MVEMRAFHESDQPYGGRERRRHGAHRRPRAKQGAERPDTGLYVTLGQYDPNIVVAAHSHNQPELIYILEGTVTVGGRPVRRALCSRFRLGRRTAPLEAGPDRRALLGDAAGAVEYDDRRVG